MMKDMHTRVDTVQKSTENIKKKEEKKEQENRDRPIDMQVADMMFPSQAPQQLAIMGGPMGASPVGMSPNMGNMGYGTNPQMGQNMGGMGGMGNMNMGQF